MTIILSINAGSSSLKTTLFIGEGHAEGEERKLRRLGSAEIVSIEVSMLMELAAATLTLTEF
jgi:acetate kinase